MSEITPIDARNSLIEHVSEVVSVVDAQGIFTYISPSVTSQLGWSQDEVIGRPILDYLSPERHPDFDEVFEAVKLLPGTHGPFGLNLRTKGGAVRLMQSLVTNRLDDPSVRGLVTVARDETERVAASEERRRAEARYRALVQFSSDIVVLVDPTGLITYASPSVERILGIPATGSVSYIFDVIHPDDRPLARRIMQVAADTPERIRDEPREIRVLTGEGTFRTLEVVGSNLVGDPDVGGIVFNGRDVTERRWAEDLVAEQALVLEGIARGSSLATAVARVVAMIEKRIPGALASIGELDPDGVIRHRRAMSFPGRLVQALNDHPIDGVLGVAVRGDAPVYFTDISLDPLWNDVQPAENAAGFESCWCVPFHSPDESGQLGMLTVLHPEPREPTVAEAELLERARNLAAIAVERRRFEGRLEHQALHDVLTGLPNRMLIMDRVERALARTRRSEVDVAVLFVDLDNFKLINDSLGHSAGDILLERVAERFAAAVRPGDTVGRFGGDEFVVVCEEVGGEAGAVEVAERLAAALAEPLLIDGAAVHVSASIGITHAADGEADPHSLIRDADVAMYRAKDQGRSGHALFRTELHERLVRRLELERALRGALADGEMTVHYQPVISLSDASVAGVEALLRWDRPRVGLVGPDVFMALAEETGLIVPLDRWVMFEACQQLADWRSRGFGSRLTMSVNISARQLGDPSLLGAVRDALNRAGLTGDGLVIEITESALAADTDAALRTLERLSRLGVKLAIDDFGTGYASLDYLRRFSMADQLKIDRSFVADLDSGRRRDQAIVSASLVLARDLGFTSVAEGVETEAQRGVLTALGCDLAQGHLLCSPLPADELEEWFNRRS